MPKLTMDDILGAMRLLEKRNAEGFTTRELAQQSGVSMDVIQDRVRKAVDSGDAVFVGRKPTTGMDGSKQFAPVYRLVKKGKKVKNMRVVDGKVWR